MSAGTSTPRSTRCPLPTLITHPCFPFPLSPTENLAKAFVFSARTLLRFLSDGVIAPISTVIGITITLLLTIVLTSPRRIEQPVPDSKILPPLTKLYKRIHDIRRRQEEMEMEAQVEEAEDGEAVDTDTQRTATATESASPLDRLASTSGSGSPLDRPLRKLALKISDEFLAWVADLSREKQFILSVQSSIISAVSTFVRLGLAVDWGLYLTEHLLPAVTEHLAETKRAEKRLHSANILGSRRGQGQGQGYGQTQTQTQASEERTVDRFYRGGNLHPVVTRAGTGNRVDAECFHLRTAFAKILHIALPQTERHSALVFCIVREVLVCKVIQPLLRMLADPDFWNKLVVSLSQSSILERGELKNIQESLSRFEERTRMTLDIRLDDHQLLRFRTFEEFLDVIKGCEDLIEAEIIAQNVLQEMERQRGFVAEMEATPVHENRDRDNLAGVKVYINRLEVASKRIERKIEKLRKGGKLGLRSDETHIGTLAELFQNTDALALFERFMAREGKSAVLDVWRALRATPIPSPTQEHDDLDDSIWQTLPSIIDLLTPSTRALIDIDPAQWDEFDRTWSEHMRRRVVHRQLDPLTASVVEEADRAALRERERSILQFFADLDRDVENVLQYEDLQLFFRSPMWLQHVQAREKGLAADSRRSSSESLNTATETANLAHLPSIIREPSYDVEPNATSHGSSQRVSMELHAIPNASDSQMSSGDIGASSVDDLENHRLPSITSCVVTPDEQKGVNSFILTATVDGMPDPGPVSRTYKDFLALHGELQKRFPSTMMFRTVPEISVFAELMKSKQEIAGARRSLLQSYLDAILQVPPIRTSSHELATFLLGKPYAEALMQERRTQRMQHRRVHHAVREHPPARGPAAAIQALLVEVFDLNEKGNWFRKQAVTILLQQVFGETINRYVNVRLKEYTTESRTAVGIEKMLGKFWPDGQRISGGPKTERTDSQKEQTKADAWVLLKSHVVDLLGTLLGEANALAGAECLFAAIQNSSINAHFLYTELDALLPLLADAEGDRDRDRHRGHARSSHLPLYEL
ncbi:hypothetical protein M427DRAFT_459903 [Gonapodya prolifera JEL478]|uniref:PX domain-containing protein n=1 Tax=Gonapodya prolifera (strain JEL478) TaxID=1344416 RepID=A0A139A2N4_GONPJ|nr:hypothetical protein M427DRAFT_459903 [Gonapodya prolifera JEL478]|eukprot:KXS10908.1 hypothetical protein M427DRAFT_459903 [Gonapodya prolifera JEL478]